MKIKVCIGSACHLRGSSSIITTFIDLVEKLKLENQISIESSFCLSGCSNGVAVQVDDQNVNSIQPAHAEAFFMDTVLKGVPHEIHHIR